MVTTGNAEPPVQVSVRSCARLILAGMLVGTTLLGSVKSHVKVPTPAPPFPLETEYDPGSTKVDGAAARVARNSPVETSAMVLVPPGPVITRSEPPSR